MKITKTSSGKYKITKKAWEEIGKKAGWGGRGAYQPPPKETQEDETQEGIIQSILKGENQYFSYKHFSLSNMSDYTLMKSTIEDICNVYGIDEVIAADIVQKLTH